MHFCNSLDMPTSVSAIHPLRFRQHKEPERAHIFKRSKSEITGGNELALIPAFIHKTRSHDKGIANVNIFER